MTKYESLTTDNKEIWYDVVEQGFHIYIGSTVNKVYVQEEPFIPDHSKTYEENAIQMCKDLCTPPVNKQSSIEERVTNIEANIDYLMLLNDPDSATE